MARSAAFVRWTLVAAFGLCPVVSAAEQTAADPAPDAQVQVLTLDQERLFAGTAYGQRVAGEIDQASRQLAAENREIEARLATEEKSLTERRPTMEPAEFRVLADAFDARVVEIRRQQDEKLANLSTRQDQERQTFFRAAAPVLQDLVRETGALVILDSRAVILSADQIDITSRAIARIDQTLGAGVARDPSNLAPPIPAPADGGN